MVIPRPRLTSPSRSHHYLEDDVDDDDVQDDYEVEDEEADEDVYYNMQDLYLEHLQEVFQKLHQIDNEIWAKVIIFERNRRVAKAYVRHPLLTVNGSDQVFDGHRIGICHFDNPMRDPKTQDARKKVHQGVDIKRVKYGSITVRRLCKSNVFVRGLSSYQDNNCIGNEILRNTQGALEYKKSGYLFDRDKFQDYLMSHYQSHPQRRHRQHHPCLTDFEYHCLSTFSSIVFVHSETDLLRCPLWVLFINIEGLSALNRKVPIATTNPRPLNPYVNVQQQRSSQSAKPREQPIKYPRISQPATDRPPKLPPPRPRVPQDTFDDFEPRISSNPQIKTLMKNNADHKLRPVRKNDDPYYNGIYARVSNFVKLANNNNHHMIANNNKNENIYGVIKFRSRPSGRQQPSRFMYHPRYEEIPTSFESYEDEEDVKVKIHSRIYGHVPIPTRMILPRSVSSRYPDEWDRSAVDINSKMIKRGRNV